MIGSILQATAPLFTPVSETPEAKIGRLAHAVTTKMREVENQSRQHEMSCCALYCHWFLSLFALAEASIRLMLHLSIVLIFFLGYYVVYCLSCGKANVGMMKGHQLTRCSLYSGLMFAMIGNLIVPWNPGFYMFHLPTTLSRPRLNVANLPLDAISPLDIENFLVNEVLCCCCNCCGCRNGHCACCGQPPESSLLPYKLAQISLFSVGCSRGCGVYQWAGGEGLHRVIDQALLEIENENSDATRRFYQQFYNCESFEEFVRRDVYGNQTMQPQQIMQHQVYVQASPIQAVPIARPIY